MTLLPSSDFGIRGVAGKLYELNEICAAPSCNQRAQHGHHLWPRSYLRSQLQNWVQLPDGTVIGNRVGLCVDHHEQVTGEIGGYRARIVFSQGIFWWEVAVDSIPELPGTAISVGGHAVKTWQRVGPLTWQPPGSQQHVVKPQASDEERCSECGKPKHSKPHKPLPKRRSKDWTLTVPDDAEIGSEVLDGWADDLAEILGFAEQSSRLRRYHATATALAWVVQNRDVFVGDLIEAARS